jgi:NAD(P)-dependent dehydrogenase (short-subunit alcohol dehydrogenase family)
MLNNQIAVVTGAASGIGKGASYILAKYGATVAALDLNEKGAEGTAKAIRAAGGNAESIALDITNSEQIFKVFDHVAAEYGRIDIVVNAAGIALQSPVWEATEAMWDKTFAINIKGAYICCKAAIKYMMEQHSGRIINISSRSAKLAEKNNAAYCSSKAAVNMLTQCLALELAQYGILVNAICPSLVNTEMIRDAIINFSRQAGKTTEEFESEWVADIPLGRMAEPEEIGEFVAFLCSDKARFITGSSLNFDGGFTRI